MFEYIKDYGLTFNGSLTPRKITVRILLHHTSGGDSETVQSIHNYHLSRGHKGIDYNICVEKDGTVAWGRGLEYCGGSVNNSNASTKGMNDNSIAIVALGNFEVNSMPEAQKEALKRVTKDVASYYGIKEIKGHYEVAGRDYTDCPGKYFPLDEVKAYAIGESETGKQPNPVPVPSTDYVLTRILKLTSPMMEGEDVCHAQELLEKHLAQPGKIDGVFGTNTKEAVIRFQKARIADGYDLGSTGADGKIGQKTWEILGGVWKGSSSSSSGSSTSTPSSQPSIPTLTRNLKLTSPMMSGDDVRQAQERLEKHLANPGKIDGVFGENTREAVIRFQKVRIAEGRDLGSSGADGVIGQKTWAILWE